MRVLMISDVFYPRVNGVSTSIQTFREELQKLNIESTLIAPAYDKQNKLVYDIENDIVRVPSGAVLFDPEDRLLKKKYNTEILKLLEGKEYDLVHIQTPFVAHYMGMELKERLNIPVVETYHTFFEEYFYHYIPFLPKGLLRYVARWFSRAQCNKLDALIVPSTAMYEKLHEYGITAEINIIPTGVTINNPPQDCSKSFKLKHGIPLDRPVLLHVGRIAFEKNIDFLIDTFADARKLMPELILLITGEGPAKKDLEKKAHKLGLQGSIYFVGYLDRELELLACYQAGDIFVFASRTETQGLVLLEAMAMGLPVVSTAEMGTKDILLPGKGAIVALEDKKDFAGKLIALAKDEQRLQAMSAEATEYAKSWSAAAMAERMHDFYLKLVNNRTHQLDHSVQTSDQLVTEKS